MLGFAALYPTYARLPNFTLSNFTLTSKEQKSPAGFPAGLLYLAMMRLLNHAVDKRKYG